MNTDYFITLKSKTFLHTLLIHLEQNVNYSIGKVRSSPPFILSQKKPTLQLYVSIQPDFALVPYKVVLTYYINITLVPYSLG